jgi:hypothetical protein
LILTTHRVRQETQDWGEANIRSILLEDVAFCAGGYLSYPVLLVVAGLAALISLILAARVGPAVIGAGAFAALLLVILYFLTRRQFIRVSSAGGAIEIGFRNVPFQKVKAMLDDIEAAKNNRYLMLVR